MLQCSALLYTSRSWLKCEQANTRSLVPGRFNDPTLTDMSAD
jgi:hypothetical protein